MHRTQDTYSLSHFRQRTSEHLDRIREGRVETITQNGQAAMVVMSPERYDFLVHSAEHGHIWREAIRAHRDWRARDSRERSDPRPGRGAGLYYFVDESANTVTVVDAGLDLIGLDVSKEAIAQLRMGHPHLAPDLVQADFREFDSESLFDYIVAIQVFQHGTADTVRSMFARSAMLLKRGGLLFVRVNSASTDVYHSHRIVKRGDRGGFTVRYHEGPKRGLIIHFLSLGELREMLDPWFAALVPTREQVTLRQSPKRGSWAQWEGVWARR